MGVYGYSSVGMKIPEGYLNVKLDVPSKGLIDQKIIYPTNPEHVSYDEIFGSNNVCILCKK